MSDFCSFRLSVGNNLVKSESSRITLNLDGTPITSKSHTHPSHSQSSRLLTSSLSLGVPVPRSTQCIYVRRVNSFFTLTIPLLIHNKFNYNDPDSRYREGGSEPVTEITTDNFAGKMFSEEYMTPRRKIPEQTRSVLFPKDFSQNP